MKFASIKSKRALSDVDITKKIQSSKEIADSYLEAMGTGDTKLVCSVTMANDGFHPDIVTLDVDVLKENIQFKYENGAYGYRDTTHILTGNDMEYRLSCASSGEVRLFSMGADGSAVPYGSYNGFHQVVDPMFAFAYMGNVYIVMNAPNDETIARGVRGRAPKISEGRMVARAVGNAVILRFDGSESDILNPSLGSDHGYYASLVSDQDGMPMLLCANMYRDTYISKLPESFVDLVLGLFADESEDEVVASVFPLGVSVKRFADESEWLQVPLTGDELHGIKSVEFTEADESADKLKIIFDPS